MKYEVWRQEFTRRMSALGLKNYESFKENICEVYVQYLDVARGSRRSVSYTHLDNRIRKSYIKHYFIRINYYL